MLPALVPADFVDHLIVPEYSIEYRDEFCSYEAVTSIFDESSEWVPHDFIREGDFDFSFVAPARRLVSLRLRFATYARNNNTPLWCELRDRRGNIVSARFVVAEAIVDNEMHEIFDLRGVAIEPGAIYNARVQGRLALPNNVVAVWKRTVRPSRFDVVRRLVRIELDRTFVYAEGDRRDSRSPDARRIVLVSSAAPAALTVVLDRLSALVPGAPVERVSNGMGHSLWPRLDDCDVVLFDGLILGDDQAPTGFDALCMALHRRGCATIWLASAAEDFGGRGPALDGVEAGAQRRLRSTARRCRYILHTDGQVEDVERGMVALAAAEPLDGLLAPLREERWPKVAIVSVLYRKAEVLPLFIERVIGQSYPGEIELVLVDDASPTPDAEIAAQWRDLLAAAERGDRRVTVVRNEANLGNCAARLKGIEASRADILVVIDCDCLLNRDFVAAHVFEHARGGVDVVIGPLNIETDGRDPNRLLARLEADPELVGREAQPQDGIQVDGFVNCITRNFSIKRSVASAEPLFDLDFSYSARPDTGFGWEDVEMGYRLYARGARIRYTTAAFSVHLTHPASAAERTKVLGSMRNFEKLFVKHPDMAFAARRWALDVYDRLIGWALSQDAIDSQPARALVDRFETAWQPAKPMIRSYRPNQRRLRILSYRWHVPHQYELHKLPHDFTMAVNTGRNTDMNAWSYDQRPLRPNVTFKDASRIRAEDYDLALLHFDENVLVSQLCNGVIPASWGDPFRWLIEQKNLPKVAICHGTPQFVGQYAANPAAIDTFEVHEEARAFLVNVLRRHDVEVVCNSHQAATEWRFAKSRVIWHGFDPQEFPAGRHDLDILALKSDRHRPHYRGAAIHAMIAKRLPETLKIETAEHRGASAEPRGSRAFAAANLRSYAERIGRFRAYLNTTLRSPMPRSRGEAMMTGVFPVAIDNHDVDMFIKPGVNGFYSRDPLELADFLRHALGSGGRADRLCKAARQTALDLFNHDRYLAAWTALLAETVR